MRLALLDLARGDPRLLKILNLRIGRFALRKMEFFPFLDRLVTRRSDVTNRKLVDKIVELLLSLLFVADSIENRVLLSQFLVSKRLLEILKRRQSSRLWAIEKYCWGTDDQIQVLDGVEIVHQ